MSVNYLAVIVAAIVDFIIGAIWYMPLFGKAWGEIHGFDKLNKQEQAAAQKGMAPYMVVQYVCTVVTVWAIAKIWTLVGDYSVYTLALTAWIGFVVPTQIAAVIFGGTDPKWMVKKSAIMAGASFFCLMAAAWVLQLIK